MILTYMCSEQLWDKQYQITNQYIDRFSRNLYFVALGVGVSVGLGLQTSEGPHAGTMTGN